MACTAWVLPIRILFNGYALRNILFKTTALLLQCTAAAASEFDPVESSTATVLTPTRLKQSLADVPASVTVITAQMIRHFAIRSVPEAMRFVPGMAVTQMRANDYRINYHGTNMFTPRRMNVLIDGMSIHRSAFALVDWNALPIGMGDIERIEVTRGPNSASYGANSMLAIINIISKPPAQVEGTTIDIGFGTQANLRKMVRYGGKIGDDTAYRISIERQKDAGFDSQNSYDGTRLNKLNFRSLTDLSSDQTLDVQVAIVQGKKEVKPVQNYQRHFPDIRTQEVDMNMLWRKNISPTHDVQVQAYVSHHSNDQHWTGCVPTALLLPEMFALWQANPSYVNAIIAGKIPSGGSRHDAALLQAVPPAIARLGPMARQPTCAQTNENYSERRYDVELQDTYIVSNQLRMVSGLGFRKDIGSSQTYFGGTFSNTTWKVFSNLEYKPGKFFNINVGGFFEKDSITGASFSPRLALNVHLTDQYTMRFVASKATRMPNIYEQRTNWRYQVSNDSVLINGQSPKFFYQSAKAPGNLVGEKITSTEIGLLGHFPGKGLLFDLKIFEDRLTSLISETLQISNFHPTNTNSAILRGAEFQASYMPSNRWSVSIGYSYLLNHASTILEQTQYAKHSGTLAISHLMANGWRTSFAYSGYGASTAGQSAYGREDVTLSKTYRLNKDSRLTPAFTLSYLNNRTTSFLKDVNQSYRAKTYNNPIQLYMSLSLTL